MSQPLRIEDPKTIWFITTRTIRSRLWFVNNLTLQNRVLAYLAKYQSLFGVELFAFVLMGNHYHLIARFPKGNKASFMKAFNGIFARLVGYHVPSFREGKLWARRYSAQLLPRDEDVKHWFFYCALNPVLSGIAERISDHLSYNSFSDATSDRIKTFRVLNGEAFNAARRYNPNVSKSDFIETYPLKFSRLPGCNESPLIAYKKELLDNLEARRCEAIKNRFESGKGFARLTDMRNLRSGALPRTTKTSHRYSFRPLVLSTCSKIRDQFLGIYFDLLGRFKEASKEYLSGNSDVSFPSYTYRPPLLQSS